MAGFFLVSCPLIRGTGKQSPKNLCFVSPPFFCFNFDPTRGCLKFFASSSSPVVYNTSKNGGQASQRLLDCWTVAFACRIMPRCILAVFLSSLAGTSAFRAPMNARRLPCNSLQQTRKRTLSVANAVPGGIAVVDSIASSKVFGAAAGAVTSLVVTTAIGAQTVRSGVISPESISALARIVYGCFLPAFMATSVIHTVTAYGVQPELLAMPFVAAAQILLARAVTRRFILPFTGIDADSRAGRELSFCCTFHNPGLLPLLFFDALFSAPFPDASVLPKLVAYVSFYLMGYSPICWSIGRDVLCYDGSSKAPNEATKVLHVLTRMRKTLVSLVSPLPVAGSLTGLIVATCPFLLNLFVGSAAPLGVAYKAVERFAGGYLPSASLCLAGSLVSGVAKASKTSAGNSTADHGSSRDQNNLKNSEAEAEPTCISFKKRIAIICAARFIAMPIIGAAALHFLAAINLLPSPAAQPVLWFFLLTQFSMPPAQNSVVMLQVAGLPEGATRMARILLIVYAISTVPLTFLLQAHIKTCGLL